jgi:hypothetical protein
LQFVTSTFLSQADFLAVDQTSIENNRQPLTSILKKPSTQLHMTSFSTKTNNPLFQEIRKQIQPNIYSIKSILSCRKK